MDPTLGEDYIKMNIVVEGDQNYSNNNNIKITTKASKPCSSSNNNNIKTSKTTTTRCQNQPFQAAARSQQARARESSNFGFKGFQINSN